MTTDSTPLESKNRRFTALDCIVGVLAVCSIAAPFAARLQVPAHASSLQEAVPAEIFVTDTDAGAAASVALNGDLNDAGYQSSADMALEVALVASADSETRQSPELDQPLSLDLSAADASTTAPSLAAASIPLPMLAVAVIASPLTLDTAMAADTSDDPPAAPVLEAIEPVEEAAPKLRVIMTAPPTLTPVPIKRPFREVVTPIQTVELRSPAFQVPIDVTPPLNTVIVETPLPPLEPAPQPQEIAQLSVVEPSLPARPLAVIETQALSPTPAIPEPIGIIDSVPQPSVLAPAVTPVVVAEQTLPPTRTVSIEALPRAATPAPARPVARITNGPRIALVIAAAGLNENVTRFAIEALPAGVTLAFAPVKAEASTLAREAKNDGHTILVEVPMEPVNRRRDPGPLTLRVSDTPQENLSRLDQALARIPVADGASSYLGARFNAEEHAATPIINALAAKNLFLFENEPTPRSVFQRLSSRARLPYARGIVKFDRDRSGNAIRAALDALEAQAREQGSAIGVGSALRGTISTVALWAKQAEKRGVRLVSIREVAR